MKKIFLPLVVFLAVNASAQKVSGKLSFQKGQKIEVSNNVNSSTTMPMGESKNSSVTTEVYEVKDVTSTGATLERSIKNIKLNISIMGQEKSIDSDNPKDLEGMAGEPIKDLLKTKQEFTINDNGRVVSMKDQGKEKASGNPMMDMFMQQMSAGATVLKVGAPTVFAILPSSEVSKGQSWTDSAGEAGNVIKTKYMLKDVTASDVILDYTSEGTIDTKQEMMGMSAAVKGTTNTTGAITIDKTTGLLKQKTATVKTDSAISISGQDMNTSSTVTAVTTVKTL